MSSLIALTRVLIHLSTHRCEILSEMPLSIDMNLVDTAHNVLACDGRPVTLWKMNERPRGIPQDILIVVDTCGGQLTQANYFNLL